MKKPGKYLTRMSLFIVIDAAIAISLLPSLKQAFMANMALNGVIIGTLLIGIFFALKRVIQLNVEIDWIIAFQRRDSGAIPRPPRLLAAAAAMLEDQWEKSHIRLSTISTHSLLDGISSRLEETREISRYLTGLLVFLGLLGTFWGLLGTISAIGSTINSLTIDGSDIALMFDDLKAGLEAPLSGMGTAFSSSLFGLAGSLVLGFLDLQATQSQTRFYNDLEDWLGSITQLSPAGEGLGGGAPGSYITAVMEQTADGIDKLDRTLKRNADDQGDMNASLQEISGGLAVLADNLRTQNTIMQSLTKSNDELLHAVTNLGKEGAGQASGINEASIVHLRNMDLGLKKLLNEQTKGNAQQSEELRAEFKLLSRTIAAGLDNLSKSFGQQKAEKE